MNDIDIDKHALAHKVNDKALSLIETIQTTLGGSTPSPRKRKSRTEEEGDDEEQFDYNRTGKVARLPAPIRETVNQMLTDSAPYQAIIDKLSSLGYPGFTHCNITRWKKRGFIDWLHRRQEREATHAATTASLQLLKDLTDHEQQPVQKIVDLIFARQLLAAFAELNTSPSAASQAADVLSSLGNVIARQFRERTRYERLLLAIRRFETAQAQQKNPPENGANRANQRNKAQITENDRNDDVVLSPEEERAGERRPS